MDTLGTVQVPLTLANVPVVAMYPAQLLEYQPMARWADAEAADGTANPNEAVRTADNASTSPTGRPAARRRRGATSTGEACGDVR